jgi:4'-phosphopantetheinyl transferase
MPGLAKGDVHVWLLQLDLPPDKLADLWQILDAEEQVRASRFHFEHHRQRYISAHAGLRLILARYLNSPPTAIRYQFTEYGKPSLAPEINPPGLTFNLTHSHELGLVAVGIEQAIGVDIEHIREDLADEQVARRFFSAQEVQTLLSLPDEMRNRAFFNCWTRKEAYIKARGEGLSMPLDAFDVAIMPGEPALLMNTRPDPAQALQWNLYDLFLGSDYAAALAVQGAASSLSCWQWMG